MKVRRKNIKRPQQSKDIIVNYNQTLHLHMKRNMFIHLFNVYNK